jgi:hypothetical protein
VALGWLAGALVLGGLGYLAARDWPAIEASIATLSVPRFAASVAAFAAGDLLFALAWHRLARRHSLSLGRADDLRAWSMSLVGRYVPGRVWQAGVRTAWYAAARRPIGRTLLALLAELALAIAVAAALVLAMLHWLRPLPMGALAALVFAVVLGLAAQSPVAWSAVGRWLPRVRGWTASPGVGGAAAVAVAAASMAVGYLVFGLGAWILVRHPHASSAAMYLAVTAGLALAGLAGLLVPIVPAGLGVREAALAWVLTPAIGAGPAVFLAFATRIAMTAADGCVAAVSAATLAGSRRRRAAP